MDEKITKRELRQQLKNAADRFADLADIIEQSDGKKALEHIGFMRASALRYHRAGTAKTRSEVREMELADAMKDLPSRQFYDGK